MGVLHHVHLIHVLVNVELHVLEHVVKVVGLYVLPDVMDALQHVLAIAR
jgi:hypothetical protein